MQICGVASASALRSAAGQLALTLPKALSCAWTSAWGEEMWICSFSGIYSPSLPSPPNFFLTFMLACFIWVMKVVMYYFYRQLYYIFKGRKRLYVKLSSQTLAKMVQGNGKVCKLQLNGGNAENKIPQMVGKRNHWGRWQFPWHAFCMISVGVHENVRLDVLMF